MSETNTLAAAAAEPIAAANRKRAIEHLARFRDRPLGHFIDGTPTDGAGGTPFDVLVPSTGEVLGQALAGTAADIDSAAAAAKRAFRTWSQTSGEERRRVLHAIADAIEARAEEIALVESLDTGQPIRFMSKAALRGAENFRFFADRAPGGRRRSRAADDGPRELHDAPADRPGRRDHAVEHAVHAVDVEDRAGARGRLHRRAQAGGMEPVQCSAPRRDRARGGASRQASSIVCTGSARWPGKALTEHPRHQGDRVRRRIQHRQRDHAAGRRDAEARALRARRQESGHRVRRCRSRPRARCRGVHDLQPQRPALHLVEPAARASVDPRRVRREASPNGRENCVSGIRSIPTTEVGPLIHPRHLEKVMGYMDIARAEGASIVCGGARHDAARTAIFVQPTLFSGANPPCGSRRRKSSDRC